MKIQVKGMSEIIGRLEALTEPSKHSAMMRSAVRAGLKVLEKSIVTVIPPATTEGHATESIKNSIGSSFKRDTITTLTRAKVGVNVGKRTFATLARRSGTFEKRARKAWRNRTPITFKNEQIPHSHLYIMGTKDRYTGSREVNRHQEIQKTPTGKVRVRKFRIERTGNATMFRGRVLPKDYVTAGVQRAQSEALRAVRYVLYESIARGVDARAKSEAFEGID